MDGFFKVRAAFQLIGKDTKGIGNGGVEHDIGACYGIGRAQHPEFKLVAGKGKGGSAVSVGGVLDENGDGVNAELHKGLFRVNIIRVGFKRVQNGGQLIAEEDGDNGGGRFARAETMVVSGGCDAYSHKVLIIVNGFYNRSQKQQKLHVFMRRFAGREQVLARVGCHGPVVVLAGAVHAVKGLFMQKADEIVL